MASSWQKFEELIKQGMRKTYSEAVVEHSMNPKNLGELEDANGFARVTGPCGDTMSIWLRINGASIINASFTTMGVAPPLRPVAWSPRWLKARVSAKPRR